MEEPFLDKTDEELMKGLDSVKTPQVPEETLKGFSASVERKILEGQVPVMTFREAAPAFTVAGLLILASAMIWFLAKEPEPLSQTGVGSVGEIVATVEEVKAVGTLEESNLADEIIILKELGLWTEEDEKSIGFTIEEELSELELAFDTESLSLSLGTQAASAAL